MFTKKPFIIMTNLEKNPKPFAELENLIQDPRRTLDRGGRSRNLKSKPNGLSEQMLRVV
jgi:hypothetical protein